MQGDKVSWNWGSGQPGEVRTAPSSSARRHAQSDQADKSLCKTPSDSLTEGTVKEIVQEGSAEIKSNRGNTIKKNASEQDPAVVIEQGGVSGPAMGLLDGS